jgi:hypothetical protein
VAEERTDGYAIASLVCGIVGFFCIIPAIVAIVLGFMSLNRIKQDPALGGRGMAIAGIVLGFVWAIGGIIFGIIYVVVLGGAAAAAAQQQAALDSGWILAAGRAALNLIA